MKRLRLLGGIVLVISMFWLLGAVVSSPSASAATLNVVAGTDGIEENSQCQLSEAIQNINNQTITNVDCAAGDGIDDTITLPSGTITLTGDLPQITQSVSIVGQGMGSSVIDGDGLYSLFFSDTDGISLNYSGFTISSFKAVPIYHYNATSFSVNNLEIDGSDAVGFDSLLSGIIVANWTQSNLEVSLQNVNIHDLTTTQPILIGISIDSGFGTVNANLDNITISNLIQNTTPGDPARLYGLSIGSGTFTNPTSSTVEINSEINNLTVDNIIGNSGSFGFVNGLLNDSGDFTMNTNLNNSSITGIEGKDIYTIPSSGIGVGGGSNSSGASVVDFNARNVIVTNNINNGTSSNCNLYDVGSLFGWTGEIELYLSSLGGNISDDSTCNDAFTDPTDQNNVDPADLHLGTLGDYGGSVPTIPLLPGSIAIDSGTTVAGLTIDARGITRPQCAAYDSGAYEYNGVCPPEGPATNNDTTPLTYPDPITNSTVSLVLPSDVTNGTVSAISPSTIPKDTFFSFPLGLTSFQFSTTVGATKTITLYYDLPGDLSLYTARKYNTTTKAFSTIQGATITRVTYNNKSQIKLTYDITDGGTLDQDNTANGTVVDPVGLAQASVGVPNTGLGIMQ